ncbi:glycosyl transferase family protein [Altericroceibacterium spongiae]|uniref:Glycosyl transferase family protein n=2 Tax=Altericroceibacterium spongiae TaxID=2320269 RepID=A0A420EKL7_9SPHN|nr:glycosyl transferase family protein [Altericroceibacterium spongiae]RKF21271.1 glycosyl transferase family protein [Altericroceibacterium spongiae]
MEMGAFPLLEWVLIAERELLLFAGIFLLIGVADELAVDLLWFWMRLTGRIRTRRISRLAAEQSSLLGPAALMIPTWQEDGVIGHTIRHARAVWPQERLTMFIGCYRNDLRTIAAAMQAAKGDPRVKVVVHEVDGPTTKADCLNRLLTVLSLEEGLRGEAFRMVMLHDAEDMVDPAALALCDRALEDADFIQLPVLPQPHPASPFVSGHYCDEFAEAHGKALPVRQALGTGLPAAGVGCAFSRRLLDRMAQRARAAGEGATGPFSSESLTEDYELGLRVRQFGARSLFLRARGEDGELVATRAYFPDTLEAAIRQKARWIQGIALQGWDRLGWTGDPLEMWMRLRDRRGPFAAIVLAVSYLLLILVIGLGLLRWTGALPPFPARPLIRFLVAANIIGLGWRVLMRFAFTAREYGWGQGILAIFRIPVANLIAILAGRRALTAYVKSMKGVAPKWDKTIHHAHPTQNYCKKDE